MIKSTAVVAASLWVGALACLGLVVAPYLFILAARKSPSVPHSGVAADLVGPLLYGSDVLSVVAGVGLVAVLVYLRRWGEKPLGARLFVAEAVFAAAALCAAANYWWLTPRIRDVQGQLAVRYGAFHQADRADPLYLRFDGLHHTSTTLFMGGLVAALVGLVCMTHFRPTTNAAPDSPAPPAGPRSA